MTVRELVKALREMPEDAEVTTEGCDCLGDVASVEIDTDSDNTVSVRLCRSSSYV